MTFIRRTTLNRTLAIRPETIAFVKGDRDSADFPGGFSLWWHRFSLSDGHVHQKWQYSVAQAAGALGVDVEALKKRYSIKPRYRGEGHATAQR
jgi:hypothetical protein